MNAIVQALALIVALVLGGAGWAAVAQDPPDEPAPVDLPAELSVEQPAAIVRLKDNRFRPARVTVPAGATVRWVNDEEDESVEHNVIARDYRWAADNFFPGEIYEHTFTVPGVYRYFCDLHGGMTGQVIVE